MVICREKVLHQKNVQKAVENVPDLGILQGLSEIFKALSDPSRLKIVMALAAVELCVCDLAAVTGSSESAVSHQLRNLKIVRYRREGKIVFYRLDDDHVNTLIQQSLEHVQE